MGKGKMYTIQEDKLEAMLTEAARRGAEAGVSAYIETAAKHHIERSRDAFNATKVLLKKYRDFKVMAEKAVVDADSIEEDADSPEYLVDVINQLMQYGVDKRELDIVSNKKRVYRTVALMRHVDTMIEAYRVRCARSLNQDEQRRYRVVYALFIADEPTSTYDLAEEEHIGLTTLYATINKAYSDLSVLFFGADGLWIEKRPNCVRKNGVL